MKILGGLLNGLVIFLKGLVILIICANGFFIAYKGNQPMNVPDAPQGMTYFQFLSDRIQAAKVVEPARCGWGMLVSMAVLTPIYATIYTEVGIHPDGDLARVTAQDPDIPHNVTGARWVEVPAIWWNTVERLSWTMLGRPVKAGCQFEPVPLSNQ